MKIKNLKNLTQATILLGTMSAQANLSTLDGAESQTFRSSHATALYLFRKNDGRVVKDYSNVEPKLDLDILDDPSGRDVKQEDGELNITAKSLIMSRVAATKIVNQCQTNKGLTIELWVENNERMDIRSGEFPRNTDQPLRIMSLADSIQRTNFQIGQLYVAGDMITAAVNTNGNNVTRDAQGNIISDAAIGNMQRSQQGDIIIPNEEDIKPQVGLQQIVFSIDKGGLTRLYMSDRSGNLSRRQPGMAGQFRVNNDNIFQNWSSTARLTLGNVATTVAIMQGDQGIYNDCGNAQPSHCGTNSRYWKGKIKLAAVYCRTLTDREIVGDRANQTIPVTSFKIDRTLRITPELRRAQKIYGRLTGVKPPVFHPALAEMAEILKVEKNPVKAAEIALRDPNFINIVARDFAAPISTRAQIRDVPMNDFIATFMGAVVNDRDARDLLTANMVYRADARLVAAPSSEISDILRSDAHYNSLEANNVDLSKSPLRDPEHAPTEVPVLKEFKQTVFNGTTSVPMPDADTAGLITTRTFLNEHARAGTNRRLVEKLFEHFLCLPIERVADSSANEVRIGRDIDRRPAGSFTKFTTTCKACHTIMDGFRGAFAYVTANNNFVMHSFVFPIATQNNTNQEDAGQAFRSSPIGPNPRVHYKYNQNREDNSNPDSVYVKPGYDVVDNSWINNAVLGANRKIGWAPGSESGKGINSLGRAFANTKQFPICMATRAFNTVCGRDPASFEQKFITDTVAEWGKRGYKLKYLFQAIGSSEECLGKEEE